MSSIKKIKTALLADIQVNYILRYQFSPLLLVDREESSQEYLTLRHWPVSGLKTAASA